MSKVSITRSLLDDLATSISEKSGEAVPMTLTEMKDAVDSISVGGGGSGSSGLVLNTIQEQGEGTITYRLDKTVSEIVEALNSGISPVLIETTGSYSNYFALKSVSLKLSSWGIQITFTGSGVFKATGANAYPSYTQAGGGEN